MARRRAPSGISLQAGKPLERTQVADSLRTLYRTGNYADIRAVETPVEGGVQVDFVVQEQLFFNRVVIEGLTAPPTDSSAAATMQISLGQPYDRSVVNEGVAAGSRARHQPEERNRISRRRTPVANEDEAGGASHLRKNSAWH